MKTSCKCWLEEKEVLIDSDGTKYKVYTCIHKNNNFSSITAGQAFSICKNCEDYAPYPIVRKPD